MAMDSSVVKRIRINVIQPESRNFQLDFMKN